MKGGEKSMGKIVSDPRYNVVSLRLTDKEKAALVKLAANRDTSIGDVMRTAIKPLTDLYAESV